MSDVLRPGDDVAAALARGGTVRLGAGTHVIAAFVDAPVELVGEPGAVIDAERGGTALRVVLEDGDVVIRGLTVRGGRGELGGGLRVDGWARVRVEDCAFDGNVALQKGGAGAGIGAGEVTLARCRFAAGQDVLLTGPAEVRLVDCDVPAGLRLREGVKVELDGGRYGEVSVRGTTTRAPRLRARGAELAVDNDDALPGDVEVG